MVVREHIPLSSLTTLKVGGNARYVAECASVEDVREAVSFAHTHGIPLYVLGEGSNLLAPDMGYEGLILHMRILGMEIQEDGVLIAGAGTIWDDAVRQAAARGLWGIENLAAIPGTIGAAPVQNIGAYGTELSDTLLYVEVLDIRSDELLTLSAKECALGYRESRFKKEPGLIITKVALQLSKEGEPKVAYKDLAACKEAGMPLSTPKEVGDAVRSVRAKKFPDLREYGTAGSFFKNPTVPVAVYEELAKRYDGMPGFRSEAGVKIPLAWVLDNVLALRGYTKGYASLFERQPLVLVTHDGAHATDVDALAADVTEKVFDATSIRIEREVRTLA